LASKLASRRKRRRKEVKAFDADLDSNVDRLLHLFLTSSYHPSAADYTYKTILEKKGRKERFLSMLQYWHHVYHWGILTETENVLNRSLDERSFACIPGRGQHMMVKMISRDMKLHPELKAFANLDVSKMYPHIQHDVPKAFLRKKIKDPVLLNSLDAVIDSSIGTPIGNGDPEHPAGIAIGLKISTIYANISLGMFDHDVRRLFGLFSDSTLIHKMSQMYVYAKKSSARTEADRAEVARGDSYLESLFAGYVAKGIRYYYRFMDNVLILHEDKTFLHLVVDWIALYWANELKLTMNPKWQVGATKGGFTIVGYRVFSDGHIRANREVIVDVKRKIRKGLKIGLTYDQIRIAISSQLGTVMHADSKNFLKIYHMEKKERLGAKINRRRSQCPFEIAHSQQRRFENFLYDPEQQEPEDDYLMELRDYAVIDSIKEMNDDGTPKKCLAIRFEWQGKEFSYTDDRGKSVLVKPGEEYFSYTGSKVLIEQCETEFTKEDLPAPTVIKIEINKRNKKFYKFT
jgi:hypothetical protein